MNEGNNYYSDEEFNELVNLISEAKNKFNLVVFIGAGVSLSQGYPNWSGYVEGLIHFWQFEIRNLLPDKNIITTNLITTFDEILKSSNNEKRKIDLLYTLLDENLGKKFENNQLDFEKFYFEKVVPKNVENIILTQLIRLDPIYITSNYDFEIEKHLRRFKQPGDYRTINNIHECSETKQLIANDVLHLHGTSEGSPDFFVRSSSDYSKLYLKKEPSDFKNLSQWFLEKKPLVLFLGSSMEEEEILSLLPSTTKNFALMRANSFETSYYRNIYNKMFQKNNQTTIFWYGDNYDSLPTFVKKLVDAIEDLQQTSEKKKDWDTLHSFLTSNESYEITLAKYINDSQFLDDLCQINDQALEQKLITIVLSNPLISDSMIKTFHFWELLERNFATLSEIQIDNVVSIYETKTFSLHRKSIFVIYEKKKLLILI